MANLNEICVNLYKKKKNLTKEKEKLFLYKEKMLKINFIVSDYQCVRVNDAEFFVLESPPMKMWKSPGSVPKVRS